MASYTDYLWTSTGGAVTILGGLWVRLHNNNTGTDYYSSAVTDASTGAFTHSAPTGDYSLYSGTAATVGGTPNLRNGHYAVAARSGDDPAFNSATVVGGTYTPSALALAGGQIWGTKVIQGPPPSGGDDTTTLTNLVAGGGLVLRLQPGTYNWSSIITLASNALIQGAGAGATILNWTGGNVSGGNAALEVPNTTSDVGFQDLTIQGAAATGANNGKLVRLGGTRSALIRCTINQTGNSSIDGAAIFFNSYTTVTIRDCTILSAGAYTVRFNSSVGASTDFRFTNNRVSNSNAAAAGGLVHFDGAGGAGFTDILIADNYLGPCTGHNGVLMQNNYSRINCSRNNVKLCTRMGIEISNGTTEVVIDGNDIDYTGVTTATGWPISAGIGTASPTGYTISDNIINGANVPGVAFGI